MAALKKRLLNAPAICAADISRPAVHEFWPASLKYYYNASYCKSTTEIQKRRLTIRKEVSK